LLLEELGKSWVQRVRPGSQRILHWILIIVQGLRQSLCLISADTASKPLVDFFD
jgi:hypothetical protein